MTDHLFNNHDGHRGSTQISGITYADLYDFIYHIAEPCTFDRDALCQQVCVEVEKAQGIFPNIPIEKCETPPMEFKDWVHPDDRDRQWHSDVNAATWAFQKREAERKARKCVLSAFSAELMTCLEYLDHVRTGTDHKWCCNAGHGDLQTMSRAIYAKRLVVHQEKQQ